jgi:hypothetical protein
VSLDIKEDMLCFLASLVKESNAVSGFVAIRPLNKALPIVTSSK